MIKQITNHVTRAVAKTISMKNKAHYKVFKSVSTAAIMAPLVAFGTLSAHADDAQKNPYEKTYKLELPKDTHPIYLGLGLSNELMHLIAEKPTTYGNFYARIGQFYDGEDVAGQVGYRYPYKLTGKNNNGVYVGAFIGHVEDDRDKTNPVAEDQRYNRLGAGMDLSYVWFDTTRVSALSIGLYVPEKKKLYDGTQRQTEPALMFSYSLAAGLF